jgi:hypothetical protein
VTRRHGWWRVPRAISCPLQTASAARFTAVGSGLQRSLESRSLGISESRKRAQSRLAAYLCAHGASSESGIQNLKISGKGDSFMRQACGWRAKAGELRAPTAPSAPMRASHGPSAIHRRSTCSSDPTSPDRDRNLRSGLNRDWHLACALIALLRNPESQNLRKRSRVQASGLWMARKGR